MCYRFTILLPSCNHLTLANLSILCCLYRPVSAFLTGTRTSITTYFKNVACARIQMGDR